MAQASTIPVVVIAGPTASGKSRCALDCALSFGGTIINADAMQVYKGLAVLTAAPTVEDMARVPHRLYGIVDPAEPFSAGQWLRMAVKEIEAAHSDGRLPILVGGTGLYLRTMLSGIAQIPPIPAAVRQRVRRRFEREGSHALHQELSRLDPATAARLVPGDRQRIARALEVLEATERPLSSWLREPAEGAPSCFRFLVLLLMPSRAPLYAAINARFAQLVEAGGLDEVRSLMTRGLDPSLPAMKALGVRELGRHISGEITLEEAIHLGQQATRRYAKRQITWFRRQIPITRQFDAQYSERMSSEIFSQISSFLLTMSR